VEALGAAEVRGVVEALGVATGIVSARSVSSIPGILAINVPAFLTELKL
jgi:hypothetical protein